jgi:hypothetical protein
MVEQRELTVLERSRSRGMRAGAPRTRQRQGSRIAVSASSHYFAKPLLGLGPVLFAAAIAAILYAGWVFREEEYITAKSGLGYWLGIAGSLLMLMVLLYPLRKRFRSLRALGRVPSWFRSHMLLGVIGPTLILFHANFRAGSLNSSVALFFMLVIVASGIIGRYLFAKIHMGLYGSKAEIRQLLADADVVKHAFGNDFQGAERLLAELGAFESRVLVRKTGFFFSVWSFLVLGYRAANVRQSVLRQAKQAIDREGKARGLGWSARRKRLKLVRQHLDLYFATVNKAARFEVYERMFALWHVLHMPLFFLLVLSAILHVIAVHLY